MSESKVSARDYLLLADIGGTSTFKPIACITTNSFTSKGGTIDATSKCGNEFQQGPTFDQSFKVEGFAIDETGAPSKDSYQQLYAAHIAKTDFAIKMGKVTPVAGDITYSATVFISDFDVKADDKELVKFSATLVVTLPPATQTETV